MDREGWGDVNPNLTHVPLTRTMIWKCRIQTSKSDLRGSDFFDLINSTPRLLLSREPLISPDEEIMNTSPPYLKLGSLQ